MSASVIGDAGSVGSAIQRTCDKRDIYPNGGKQAPVEAAWPAPVYSLIVEIHDVMLLTVSNSHSFNGLHSAKFELRDNGRLFGRRTAKRIVE